MPYILLQLKIRRQWVDALSSMIWHPLCTLNIKQYPVVLRLSIDEPQSLSLYPTNFRSSVFLNDSPWVIVVLIYLNTLFTAIQCASVGFPKYCDNLDTLQLRSGLVAIMAYTNEPTALLYNLLSISLSSSLLSINLSHGGLYHLHLSMLNLYRTFCRYCSWLIVIHPSDILKSIPKNHFSTPISVILKRLLRRFLVSFKSSIQFVAIIRSSTHTSIYTT